MSYEDPSVCEGVAGEAALQVRNSLKQVCRDQDVTILIGSRVQRPPPPLRVDSAADDYQPSSPASQGQDRP